MPVIDTHAHIVSPDRVRYPLAPFGVEVADRVAGMPVSADALLEEMRACGVDRALFVQYQGVYGYDNAYVVDSVGSAAGRSVGVCIVDALSPIAAETLTELVVNHGIRGVRMMQTATEPDAPWLHDERALSVWDCARQVGIPVVLARTPAAADPAPERHLPRLRALLERYPDVQVALDHLAIIGVRAEAPALSSELLALAEFPNVYCKLTTVNLYRAESVGVPYETFFEPLFNRFGSDRIMWGSNYPATFDRPYSGLVEFARRALDFLDATDLEWTFGRTALRLWPELT